MTSCAGEQPDLPPENTSSSETLPPEDVDLPDPITVFPENKSTGKLNPAIVQTKYPTEDVIIADIDVVRDGYAVDPTGRSDSTKGIQKALDDVSAAGGGTVWLPAGIYVISDTISIPAFVTLRGDWQDPDTGSEYGTLISVWNKPTDQEVSAGTFMLGGSGGVIGLTVYYDTPDPGSTGYYAAYYRVHWMGEEPDWSKWEFDDDDDGAGNDCDQIDMVELTIVPC